MKLSTSLWRTMGSGIDNESILINCSIARMETPPSVRWLFWYHIQEPKVREALVRMKEIRRWAMIVFKVRGIEKYERGKTIGPDDIPRGTKKDERRWSDGPSWYPNWDMEIPPKIAIVWITILFNHVFRPNKMIDEWRSMSVSIYKNKGGI
jgi:hypothetical protein